MKKLLFISMILAMSSAHADLFQGGSTGTFTNPIGSPSTVTTGVNTNNFTWGVSANSNPASTLTYTGAAFNVDENTPFTFGSLYYYNGTIQNNSGADAVDLNVTLSFTAPTNTNESFTFNLGLINTPNTSDPNASADFVNFDNTVPTQFFSYNGVDYTLEFLGFGTLSGSGFTVADAFHVLENDSANVDLIGKITSTPSSVPVPAAAWLFSSGLIGLASIRKRKTQA